MKQISQHTKLGIPNQTQSTMKLFTFFKEWQHCNFQVMGSQTHSTISIYRASIKRNFPRKQTKPNKLNYNTKGLKKKHTYLRDLCTANLRSANLNSQHVQKKKKITKKGSIETNSNTNETNNKNGVLDLSLTRSHSKRS